MSKKESLFHKAESGGGAPPRVAVIMAGGAGERFWPYSRRRRPKQLLRLTGEKPMLTEAVERIARRIPRERVFIIAGESLRRPILGALGPDFPRENVIAEPEARNTAPCLALAAAVIRQRFGPGGATMAVLTADHLIEPDDVFLRQVDEACTAAERSGALVMFGVPPTEPHTGFGYIECGRARPEFAPGAYEVLRFREKPNAETARQFLEAGNFFWNSGMFFWTTAALLEAFAAHQPAMARAIERLEAAWGAPRRKAEAREAFASMEKLPIDVAILERAANRLCLRAEFRWEDIGSWTALSRIRPPDTQGNVVMADLTALDTRDCVFFAPPGGRRRVHIAALGVSGLIVVVTDGAVLVASRDRAQDIKSLLAALRDKRKDLT